MQQDQQFLYRARRLRVLWWRQTTYSLPTATIRVSIASCGFFFSNRRALGLGGCTRDGPVLPPARILQVGPQQAACFKSSSLRRPSNSCYWQACRLAIVGETASLAGGQKVAITSRALLWLRVKIIDDARHIQWDCGQLELEDSESLCRLYIVARTVSLRGARYCPLL